MSIANTPKPPYYAVIFSSQHTKNKWEEYEEKSAKMVALAKESPGFLGVEFVRDENGFGITSVYWKDKESIDIWRHNEEHNKVKKRGRSIWYEKYFFTYCKGRKRLWQNLI